MILCNTTVTRNTRLFVCLFVCLFVFLQLLLLLWAVSLALQRPLAAQHRHGGPPMCTEWLARGGIGRKISSSIEVSSKLWHAGVTSSCEE